MTLLVQFLHQHVLVAFMLIQMEIVFLMWVFQKLLQFFTGKLPKNVPQVKFQMDLEAVLPEPILSLLLLNAHLENSWMIMVLVKLMKKFQQLLIHHHVQMD